MLSHLLERQSSRATSKVVAPVTQPNPEVDQALGPLTVETVEGGGGVAAGEWCPLGGAYGGDQSPHVEVVHGGHVNVWHGRPQRRCCDAQEQFALPRAV
jgi:hypothetical protein